MDMTQAKRTKRPRYVRHLLEQGVAAGIASALAAVVAVVAWSMSISDEPMREITATVVQAVDSSAPHVIARTASGRELEVYELAQGLPREGATIQLEVSEDGEYAREAGASVGGWEWLLPVGASLLALAISVMFIRAWRLKRGVGQIKPARS